MGRRRVLGRPGWLLWTPQAVGMVITMKLVRISCAPLAAIWRPAAITMRSLEKRAMWRGLRGFIWM